MLQLSLGYVIQADREREVVEDLRSRQSLGQAREPRSVSPGTSDRSIGLQRGPAQTRVRRTGI